MNNRLLHSPLIVKLLGVIALVGAVVTALVWLAIDLFALDYFSSLLDRYQVPLKAEVMKMFLDAAHRGLVAGSILALVAGLTLGFVLVWVILGPLYQMMAITRAIALGDYTARVQVSSQDEIGELGNAFNAMSGSLQRLEQLRKKMVIDIAHELRAPLTNMRGYLEALNDGVLPSSPTVIESLQEETLRLSNLSEDLMRLSVADAARLTLQLERVDLRALIAHSLKLFHIQFSEKEITVAPPTSVAIDPIRADAEKLAQVMQNLLHNAWRYTPHGGHVSVSVERTAGWVKVVCANTGAPISTEDQSLIFERFYRIDKSRTRDHDGGAGIGLAIVKELIEAHRGRTGAESAGGRNRIWFILPT